jgi:hypothetical protein
LETDDLALMSRSVVITRAKVDRVLETNHASVFSATWLVVPSGPDVGEVAMFGWTYTGRDRGRDSDGGSNGDSDSDETVSFKT